MTPSESLSRRIVKAYLLFAVVFSLFFAVVAVVVVEGIEQRMVYDRLEGVATWALPRHAVRLPVDMPVGLRFYHGGDIPRALRGLTPGIHDIDVEGAGLQLLAGADKTGPYVVVDHESDYEQVELAVFTMLLLCLLVFVALSVALGRFVARRFVRPIEVLSRAVLARRVDLPLLDSADELGILARAFHGHTSELKDYLERERAFTGDVSHELRTPLTVILGAAELVQRDTQERPGALAAARRIERAAREAAETVEVLLLLARAPASIEAEPIAMAALLRDEIAHYGALVAGKPVTLGFDGGADFTIVAPRRLVAAAVGNLVRNACLYTDQGRVGVAIDGHAVVVRDSGRGLPADVLSMLSAPASAHRLRGSQGTGLGLALVKRICRQLNAPLEVASAQGGGTVFKIEFGER